MSELASQYCHVTIAASTTTTTTASVTTSTTIGKHKPSSAVGQNQEVCSQHHLLLTLSFLYQLVKTGVMFSVPGTSTLKRMEELNTPTSKSPTNPPKKCKVQKNHGEMDSMICTTSTLDVKKKNLIKKVQKSKGVVGIDVNVDKSKKRTASTLVTKKKKMVEEKGAVKITSLVAPIKGRKELSGGNTKRKFVSEGLLKEPGLLAPSKKRGIFYKEGRMMQDLWNSSEHNDFADGWEERDVNFNSKTEMENSFGGSEINRSMVTPNPATADKISAVKGKRGLHAEKKHSPKLDSGLKKKKGGNGSKAERKVKAKQKNEHEKPTTEQESNNRLDKRHLVGEPVGVILTKEDSIIAALAPGKALYLQGVVSIRALIGSVEVLGYEIKETEMQIIYSLPTAALLGVKAIDVRCVESSDPLLRSRGVPAFWLQDVMDKQADGISVIEFERVNPPPVQFLNRVGWKHILTCQSNQPWTKIGASVVTPRSCSSHRLMEEGSEWHSIIDTIRTAWNFGSLPRVVVCGGKGVGKSTFFKYLANSLLTTSSIFCLDLDPGQPEFSLPTCLSLIKLNKPLLGPPHTQHISDIADYKKQMLVGDLTPQLMLQRYLATVERLTPQDLDSPLIVNTMGWVEGTGLAINVDVIRTVRPTHVVQINSQSPYKNFAMDMKAQAVMKTKECIITKPRETELHYSFTTLRSVTSSKGTGSFPPRELRELRVLNEVSHLMQGGKGEPSTIVVPWNTVALCVCGEQIPRERILQVINGQLVALCHVNPDCIEMVRSDLPKHLQEDASFGDLISWGIITGINSVARELHILVSSSPQIRSHVNAIIRPKLQLPASVYKQLSSGSAPYLQSSDEMGKPRLRVGRQLKPRGRSGASKK